ncbi:MAG: tRNA(Met) cytidine acetyltransferase [Alteromonadaceae bacterium]|nr:tRNA(Met) cytidine acetyltransferase [Alteromonadaceae bacterium]
MRAFPKLNWQHFIEQIARLGQRRLILVEGEPACCRAWVAGQLEGLQSACGLWVGASDDAARAGLPAIAAKQYKRWLGQELDVLVWDGWRGNSPDGFAALAGTLRAGGLVFWLMPPLAQWGEFADPDYQRMGLEHAPWHGFAARQARVLAEASGVIRVSATRVEGQKKAAHAELPALPEPQEGDGFCVGATSEQRALVAQLVRFGQGRRRRPLVVTADRGRGKSAALGMAAAELLLAGREQVVVAAPAVENVRTLFEHARQQLGDQLAEQGVDWLLTVEGHRLGFWPVQQLLAERPKAEVVMVDEAAAIPAHSLRQVLLGWPRVAFASTVHGYEGTGRGFALRFRAVLDRETPRWQQVTLSQPIRWAREDPLEALIFRLFLLNAGETPEANRLPGEAVTIESWRPAEASEEELAEAFGLLVNAHYRTTPSDLRQWLDDPNAQSWLACCGGRIVGVLWTTVEGGLPEALAQQVMLGKRRLRGHLLAQSLASHGGFAEAASQCGLRIVRVAVLAQSRGQGVGRRLVEAARGYCRQGGLDYLGTSFGGEPGLLRFWRRSGLQVARLGLQQEASTGEFPIQMLNGVSRAGVELANSLAARFSEHWQVLLPRHWQAVSAELLMEIGRDLPATQLLSGDDWRDLHSFAHGFRGFELALPVLIRLSASEGFMGWLAGRDEADVWCKAVLQGWEWQSLRLQGFCQGQKAGEAGLRQLVQAYLADFGKNGRPV